MNSDKKRNGGKKSAIPGLVILAAVLMLNAVDDPEAAVAIVVLLVIIGVVAATVASVRKAAGKGGTAVSRGGSARPAPMERNPAARRVQAARRTETEEAVHCAHSRGREKYLEQIEGFLANGIIDKAEYRLLKERYSKLEIEDDYH